MRHSEVAFVIRRRSSSWVVPLGVRRLRYLAQEGRTAGEISAIAGTTPEDIAHCLNLIAQLDRNRPAGQPPTVRLMPKAAMMSEMWKGGAPVSSIAEAVQCSEGVVRGFISTYRHMIDPQAFPLRLGTARQIKPRLGRPATTDRMEQERFLEIDSLRHAGMTVEGIARATQSTVSSTRHAVDALRPLSPAARVAAERFRKANDAHLAHARKLWDLGANHEEIARHYRMRPAAMLFLITQARRHLRDEWFPHRQKWR